MQHGSDFTVVNTVMFHYVYILQSKFYPGHYHVGCVTNLQKRLAKHNQGVCKHTVKYKPWKITTAISFEDCSKAYSFGKYLKSHSRKAFAKKHFIIILFENFTTILWVNSYIGNMLL